MTNIDITSGKPAFKKCVINFRSGGSHLTVRFHTGNPLVVYIGDITIAHKDALAIGRIAGREGVTGLDPYTRMPGDAGILASRLIVALSL